MYGLLIAMTLAVYVNIVFVSKEILLSKWSLVKPILVQIALTVTATFIVLMLNQNVALGNFTMFALKGSEFVVVYVVLNHFLKTEAYGYFMNEFRPVIQKLLEKIYK